MTRGLVAAMNRRMSLVEWVGVFAAALALLASFLPWRALSGPIAEVARGGLGVRAWTGAWGSGFSAWFPVLLLILAAVLIVAPRSGAGVTGTGLWLVCAAAAVVIIVINWITVPQPNAAELSRLGLNPGDVSASPGWGLYLGFAAAVLSMLAALVRLRAVRRSPASTGKR